MNVKLEYCPNGIKAVEEKILSLEQLEKRLYELKGILTIEKNSDGLKCIATVDVVMESIGRISIALDEKCILLFYDETDDIYFNSLGDPFIEGDTEELYDFGQPAESSNKYIIQYKDGLIALKDWIDTKKLSKKIKWTNEIL